MGFNKDETPEQVIGLTLPLDREAIKTLRAGMVCSLSGMLITGRDAAHKRIYEALQNHDRLPVEIYGETIYYTGPCPAPPGRVIGSAGPTTSGRMDLYTPALLSAGLAGMIGKGQRAPEVIKAIQDSAAVYFAAFGGAGAFLAGKIVRTELAAYPELGPEAIYRLQVQDFPVIVAVDCMGGDLYREGPARYRLL
ncbi:MAG: FumA C-terminus/TtdB family hydratase beta subunit [Bacillota bacterium]